MSPSVLGIAHQHMRAWTMIAAALFLALCAASVVRWIPVLASIGIVSTSASVYLARRPPPAQWVVFVLLTSFLVDWLDGWPLGLGSVAMLGVMVVAWPIISQFLRLGDRGRLAACSCFLAFAESAAWHIAVPNSGIGERMIAWGASGIAAAAWSVACALIAARVYDTIRTH